MKWAVCKDTVWVGVSLTEVTVPAQGQGSTGSAAREDKDAEPWPPL